MSSIVEDHRKMMILSGNLSDFQIKNISKYPSVFYPGFIESRVDYDFGGTGVNHAGTVQYKITLEKIMEPESKEKEEDALNACVKFLFWKETDVRISYEYR